MNTFIIYRKSDGIPLLQEGVPSNFTKKTYDTSYSFNQIVNNCGGIKDDYSIYWIEDKEIEQKTKTHNFTIQKGEIVFGAEKIFEAPPKQPSLDDYLLDLDFRLSTVELGL